jgi:hypothetical protein
VYKQGLPETLDELGATVNNSISAFLLGTTWAALVTNGIDPDAFPAETVLVDFAWNPSIFTTDPPEEH